MIAIACHGAGSRGKLEMSEGVGQLMKVKKNEGLLGLGDQLYTQAEEFGSGCVGKLEANEERDPETTI